MDIPSGSPTAGRASRAPGMARRFLRSGQVRLGVGLVLATTAFALLGPLLTPFDPLRSVSMAYAPPDAAHPLGTDNLGRDVLSRLMAGGIHLAWMAPAAAILGVGSGAAIGMIAAFRGGIVDAVLMRTMDVLLAFPGILFALLFVSIVGPQPWLLILITAIALMPGCARVIRGATLPFTASEFVLWGRAVGLAPRRILVGEILPNVTSPLLVEFWIRLMLAVGLLASLSFIGYGIQAPTPDWGLMVSENRSGLSIQPLAVVAPIIFIVLYTVGGNLIAEGAARVIGRTEGKVR